MALDIVVTTSRWKNDPTSRSLVGFLDEHQADLGLSDGVVYYDFPAYADYEASVFRPDILLLSPSHGFVAIRAFEPGIFQRSRENIREMDVALDDFVSNLHSRLIRSRELRKGRTGSIVDIHPVIFLSPGTSPGEFNDDVESTICGSLEALASFLRDNRGETLGPSAMAEVRSVVEGAKALSRPTRRSVEDPGRQPLAAALARLESEITNFDEKQRHIALVDVGGPARIRGLAGSGKTVILAMKAAHIHLVDPEAVILITFYTRSLRATIKTLVTRFYRLYSDSDPDWKHVHIRHGWGGSTIPGVYSDACARSGRTPLRLPEAQRRAGRGETAFGAACADLINSGVVKPFYDHVLIDEGQDFPDSFYRLAFQLAKGDRDKKSVVWAYDELQDIMNVKIRQPIELFGRGPDGVPLVDLDRTAAQLPPGATNDAVLSKAYRNQRDVLVAAHALGFGVYGNIVQMLESAEHWEDVGYQVVTGPLKTGHPVVIVRPDRNSPLSVAELQGFPTIDASVATDFEREIEWAVSQIRSFISGGLQPEELLVIALDDRNARNYLRRIAEKLSDASISSNNVIADPYNEPPFTIAGKVTLSTVYRAKGNEAAAVVAVGIDAVDTKLRDGRNKIFTAFTRSKAWLRVSGIAPGAAPIIAELRTAVANSPRITFTMPNLKEIETIQRGFSKKQAAAKAAREQYLKQLRAAGFSEEEIEEEIQQGFGNE
ncbi:MULTISPECIES: ATP-binding domain-containing protein [unclassified Bradyrhizobium]|uniref:DEAD/DEAH box helicase n=1 Tax=unclassified Bradyrhizobium TaxID=2631580 RepID=UPI001CD76462|nr:MULTISPECIES: ATP-binding domain-containing protein [unclassified Bradyrhizobium]MCA1426387.1 DEAD/DEAH box helicase [Bradyrhizobium sp. NBAIM16]MCA1505172.1 DEAD/DEAH box helicase [Bradyrhizobium sp. NBAIM02]